MEYFGIKLSTAIAIAIFWIIFRYALDIFMYLTNKTFDDVTTYQFHFTRNDTDSSKNDKTQHDQAGALHMRCIKESRPLKSIIRNKFLFYFIIYRAYKSSEDYPVLSLGKYAPAIKRYIRKYVVPIWSSAQIKRDAGLSYVEQKMQVCLIYDRDGDGNRFHTIKIVLIKNEDLENFQRYIDKPPRTAKNFGLLKKIWQAYELDTSNFFHVQQVAS